MSFLRKLTLTTTALIGPLMLPAIAADMPKKGIAPEAPAAASPVQCKESAELPADAFGFGSGSDVAAQGAPGLSLEYNGGLGTRFGKYDGGAAKLQYGRAILPCLEFAPSLSVGYGNQRLADGYSNRMNVYGGGVEFKYKILGRRDHGFGVTLTTEHTYNRGRTHENIPDDGIYAARFGLYTSQVRLLVDRELMKDKLYSAFNLIYDGAWTGNSGVDNNAYARASNLTASLALSWQLKDGFFIGAEGRHMRAYDGNFFNKAQGEAWFAGPTFFYKISEPLTLSGAFATQLAGKAKGEEGKLDLSHFPRHQFKLKAAYSF